MLFAGTAERNGQGGYRFEAFAREGDGPAVTGDSLRVTVYDSANTIVVQFDDVLDGGNVQPVR